MLMASSGAPGGRVRVAMEPRERDGLNDQATRATLLAVCKISTDRKARMQAGLDGGAAAAEAAAKAATAAEAVAVAIARAARASAMVRGAIHGLQPPHCPRTRARGTRVPG